MSLAQLSDSTQNYLKIIWSITEHSEEPASTSLIAARAGLRLSSVSDAVKRLAAAGLVEHQPYGAIELTELGRNYALSMIRRHRLIETFLVRTLGYSWDQVHDEAEILEHAVSDTLVERLDALLGYPTRDPHGDPIPSREGEVERLLPLTLAGAARQPGTLYRVRVERISDADPGLLRRLAHSGVGPGSRLTCRVSDQGEQVVVTAGAEPALTLDTQSAEAVLVSPLSD